MKWGLAIISIGGIFIMMSQLPPVRNHLIISGVLLMLVGLILFLKGKKEQ